MRKSGRIKTMISKSTMIAGLTRYFYLNNRTTWSYYNEQTKKLYCSCKEKMVFLRKVLNDDNDSGETVEGRKRFAVRGLLTYVWCLSPRMLTNTARRLALEQAHAARSALLTPCNPCHFVIPLSNRPAPRIHGSVLPLASSPLLGHLCPSVIIPVSKQWLLLPSQHPPFVT